LLIAKERALQATGQVRSSRWPAIVVGWTIAACGVLMFMLMAVPENSQNLMTLGLFGSVMIGLSIVILALSYIGFSRDKNGSRSAL
jgi:hypothetical protein